MYKHILIPTDGSECSNKASREGLKLAKALGASVTFLYAVEDPMTAIYTTPVVLAYEPELYKSAKQAGETSLKEAQDLAAQEGVTATTQLVEKTSPSEAILQAQKEADLIVIGTHGRRGFNRFVFGSVTEAVMRRATTPCLIIRHSDKAS